VFDITLHVYLILKDDSSLAKKSNIVSKNVHGNTKNLRHTIEILVLINGTANFKGNIV